MNQYFALVETNDSGKKKPVIIRKAEQSEAKNIEVSPRIFIPEALVELWPKVESTKKECIVISTTPDGNLPLTASKFGGYPCLPAGFEYPKDNQGNFLFPLLQINCGELPPLAGYPNSGFIQCYISGSDGTYGMDIDNPENRQNFRVLYFTEAEVAKPTTDFAFLDAVMTGDVPVNEPYRLGFSTGVEFVGIGDVAYSKDPERTDLAARFPEKAEPGVLSMDAFVCAGHKIGGYNCFTQFDLRETKPEYNDFVALIQIDSADGIMWGDMGLGHFFIHPDALAKKNFSQVLYYWDCF